MTTLKSASATHANAAIVAVLLTFVGFAVTAAFSMGELSASVAQLRTTNTALVANVESIEMALNRITEDMASIKTTIELKGKQLDTLIESSKDG